MNKEELLMLLLIDLKIDNFEIFMPTWLKLLGSLIEQEMIQKEDNHFILTKKGHQLIFTIELLTSKSKVCSDQISEINKILSNT